MKRGGKSSPNTTIISGKRKTVARDLVARIHEKGFLNVSPTGGAKQITLSIEAGSVLPNEDFLNEIVIDVQTGVEAMKLSAKVVNAGENQLHTNGAEQITSEKILGIALAHAGVNQADIHDLSMKLDTDDKKTYYEIEFKHENNEYE
jgi:hypothetical protein